MADNSESKKSPDPQEQIRAAVKSTTQGVSDSAQRGAATMEQAGRSGSEILQRGSEAGAETMRHLSEATTETARRGARGAIDVQQEFVETTAKQFEEAVGKLSEGFQQTAQEWRTLMEIPRATGVGLQDVQRSVTHTVEAVMRTNLHAMQELMRSTNVATLATIQQRFMREYLNALLDGSTIIARAVRQSADQMLHPLEQRMSRRENGQYRGNWQEQNGRVADVMEREVRVASPDDTVQQVARLMREEDTGALPVGEGDRLVGMVTDRDVTVRLVAEGRDPARTKVREVMSPEVRYVFEDEDLEHVADNMAEQQVRRLPVVNRQKRLVGVVSLGDIAKGRRSHLASRALRGIARESGQHTQTAAE
jgi:CBS domain-containing protein